ncbi:MAG: hypothetical protein GX033_09970 [Firmicutes bacterium]|nr:hypothetical protein [Bacillota bacterium]
MASHLRISGPLFVRSSPRGRVSFSLVVSNLSINDVLVRVKVYGAAFSGFDTAVTWVQLADEDFPLESGQTDTLEFRVDKKFDCYQFNVENSLPNLCFHAALYLLSGKQKPLRATPLVVGNEWELIEIKP